MFVYVARRLAGAVFVVFATAFFAYGGIRFLRDEQFEGQPWLSSTLADIKRALLHLDFGEACMYVGCPKIHQLWVQGILIDLTLLGVSLVLGAGAGTLLGRWCAAHRASVAARALERAAMVFYCAPPYLVGYLALLAFDPYFGAFPLHFLIDPNRLGVPFEDVPHFITGMTLPWLICSAPVAAACLRLTLALTVEAADEDYVRTAVAKGLRRDEAIRRHAGPVSRSSVAAYIGAAVPGIVLNVVLVEFVFAVPGFFKHTWRAFGKAPGYPPGIDYPVLRRRSRSGPRC